MNMVEPKLYIYIYSESIVIVSIISVIPIIPIISMIPIMSIISILYLSVQFQAATQCFPSIRSL